MERATALANNKFNFIIDKLSVFLYGKYFPVYLALIVTLCYVTNISLVSLAIFSLIASVVFLFFKDVTPIIPMLFMVVLCFRDYDVMNSFWAYVALAPAIITFIARFFVHPIKNWKPGKLFIPLVLVSFAYALAGILRPTYDFLFGIAYTVSLGPTMLVIYLFFYYNIKPSKNFNIKEYLCYCLIVTGITMIAHIAFSKITNYYMWIELGWANVNAVAAFLCLCIPSAFYLLMKAKNILLWYFIILLLYAGVYLSGSDAVFGITVIFTPILLVYSYRHIKRHNRRIFTLLTTITVSLAALAVIILVSIMGTEKTIEIFQVSFSDNGRNRLYATAIKLFLENPIFGYGLNYQDGQFILSALRVYNFHSALLHIMATMGVFGLIIYAYYYFARFRILMKNYTPFSMAMVVGFIMFEIYAMVDTCEFNAIPLMSTIMVIMAVVEILNNSKKGNVSTALPLAVNKKHGFTF